MAPGPSPKKKGPGPSPKLMTLDLQLKEPSAAEKGLGSNVRNLTAVCSLLSEYYFLGGVSGPPRI